MNITICHTNKLKLLQFIKYHTCYLIFHGKKSNWFNTLKGGQLGAQKTIWTIQYLFLYSSKLLKYTPIPCLR